MIKEWLLDNFKSINTKKELEFRPLTIFTGANSSGKSTILQSILLVTQTLQNPIASRSIVLNGWFKKFGSYSDIVYQRDYSKNIKIGFTLSDDTNQSREELRLRHRYVGNSSETRCIFRVTSNGQAENLLPLLDYMRIEIYSDKELSDTLTIIKDVERTEEEQEVIKKCLKKYQATDFVYSITTKYKPRIGYYGYREEWKYIGTGMFHFLPNYVIGYCRYTEQVKRSLSDYLLSGRNFYYDLDDDDEKLIIPIIKLKALSIVDDIYNKKTNREEPLFKRKYDTIKKKFSLKKLQSVLAYSTLNGDEKEKYVKEIIDLLDSLPEHFITEKFPMFYHPGVEFVKDFFTERIKYLGPLREEPKSLYPLESNGSSFDLGLKGENTAAVYENNKQKKISYVDPNCFENDGGETLVISEGTLAEAINKWLIFLGVAKDMNTNDRGKFGHELKITTEIEGMRQDLTHVGVGVSQILPILVMCFLSEKGDSIILEQPELHLHPKVQTRLADFFVSMNALGKQCIIETHSEYLINRLRYLVAKSDNTKVANDTMIYFVEKDKKEGFSKYRPITINPYGIIEDWPDGFFDEGEDLATKIVKAGMQKRMREKVQE